MIDNKTPARRKSSRSVWASALAAIAGAVLWLAPVGTPARADQLASTPLFFQPISLEYTALHIGGIGLKRFP